MPLLHIKSKKTFYVLVSIATFLAIAASAVGIFVAVVANGFDASTTQITKAFPVESLRPPPSPTTAENILLLGTDTRGQISSSLESAAGGRSDTMMVVHLSADRKSIQVMSIMRDSWVDIPGYGENKVNAAMALGGIPLTIQTVESIINARIDHVAIIDFGGFKELTDSIGGVQINNPIAFDSYHLPGHYFEAGALSLNGDEALAFVRERYAFVDGDYQRVKNQQIYIKAALTQLLSREVLSNPSKLVQSVKSFGRMLAVDPGLNFAYISQKAIDFRELDPDSITFFTLPSTGTGMVGDQSVVFVNWAEVEVIRGLFAADVLGSYAPPAQGEG